MKRQEVGILIIGVAVFLGFTPIFQAFNSSISSEVVGAAFSAIFILIVTKMLISHQSDSDQKAKRSEQIFAQRLELYRRCIDGIIVMLDNSQISVGDMSKLRKNLIELTSMAPDNVIRSYLNIVSELSSSINMVAPQISEGADENEKDGASVDIKPEVVSELWNKLRMFAQDVRKDLDLAGVEYSGVEREEFSKMMSTTVMEVENSIDSLSSKRPLAGGVTEFFKVGNRNQDSPAARNAIKEFSKVISQEMPLSQFDVFKSMIRFSFMKRGRLAVLLMINRVSKTALRVSFPSTVRDGLRIELTAKLGQTKWEIFPDGTYLTFNFPIEYTETDLIELRSILAIAKGSDDANNVAG